jgi:hypothetical protein
MQISAGQCADSTNSVVIDLTVPITKTMSAWAVGSGNGGLDTGTVAANTWYFYHAIRRSDTGVVDVLFSLSSTAPTLPSGYTVSRLLMAWRTNASSYWESWVQNGDVVDFQSTVNNFNVSNVSSAFRTLYQLTCPPIKTAAKMLIGFYSTETGVDNTKYLYVSSPDVNDAAATFNNSTSVSSYDNSGTSLSYDVKPMQVRTNTSGEVGFRASATSTMLSITTVGFDFSEAKGR